MKRKHGLVEILFSIALILLIFNGCIKASLEDIGTIKYVNLEGGFYGIVSDNGQKLDPVNLKDEFKKDGLRVKFVYSLKKRGSNIHQWGEVIEIISIRKI
ncbi:MAG: hypothetical protein WCE54_18580 [Ignavibacteriaceae bacterium]